MSGFDAFMASLAPNSSSSKKEDSNDTTFERDEYKYEEEQEREAMMKTYHQPMKQWFRDHPNLQEKYGNFPLFWQDLKTWEPYREVLKEYLKITEKKQSHNTTEDDKVNENEVKNEEKKETEKEAAEKKKKRKSRWGDPVPEENPVEENEQENGGEKKKKKSRWAPAGATPQPSPLLLQQQQKTVVLRAKLDAINQKLMTVAVDAARIEKDPNRSPSPPPQYDSNGKRTNTREVRMRASLEKERQQVLDEMVKANPMFRPPADYLRQKLSRKIYIPIKEYPMYNFIGLIIGPRGNTQKRMERETNCKIAIRGKGSVKEGSKGKKLNSDDNDDLHVLITGEREDDIERAAKEVQSLLVPVDDMKNEHKQKQLRELALINGTLRDDDYCQVCGEKGHRQWECPNRDQSFKPVNVKCAICGDSSHPTSDCTQGKKTAAENAAIDKEYQSFMQQLGEKPVISTANKTVAAAPWLQPTSVSAASKTQPWMMSKAAGAPGTSSAPPPPGTQPESAPAIGSTPATAYPPPGSTPATAYPPPVAPTAQQYSGGHAYANGTQTWDPQQQQQWDAQQQWASNGYYYGTWDANAQYQQYAQYAPAAGSQQYGAEYYQYAQYGTAPATSGTSETQHQAPPQ